MKKDIYEIEELIAIGKEFGLTDVSVESGEFKVDIKMSPKKKPVKAPLKKAEVVKELPLKEIKGENIGNFKSSVKIGDKVSEGDIVGTISSVGVKSSVVSKIDGEVAWIIGEDQVADYGKTVIKVK